MENGRCSYKNCQSKNGDLVNFFSYPVTQKERCKVWIENANKPEFLEFETNKLKNKVICCYHFEDSCFVSSAKTRLLKSAVPTLDVGCEKESSEPEMDVSTGLQDIQPLPSSSDGSHFILNTSYSIFSRPRKVESFIYKKGMAIPSTSKTPQQDLKQRPLISTQSTSRFVPLTQSYSFSNHHQEIYEPPEYNAQISMPHKIYLGGVYKQHNIENFNPHMQNIRSQQPIAVKHPVISNSTAEKTNLAKNYLSKIKQNSRDIACIRKTLRRKAMTTAKPDTDTILSCLKEQLPPTLFSVLNWNLNSKYKLTKEDLHFFTTIHQMSPEVYQLLVDKWNFPILDIVETPME